MHSREEIMNMLVADMMALKRGMFMYMHAPQHASAIPRSQLELLITIKHMQPVSSKRLALTLHLTPGAVSQLAEGLDQHELISRHIDPEDRRVQALSLTKRGEKKLQEMDKQRISTMKELMQDLSNEELQTWHTIQQKMIKRLQLAAETSKRKDTK